jgi:hypothetical protein
MARNRNDRKDQRRKEAEARKTTPRKEFTYTSATVGLLFEQAIQLDKLGRVAEAKQNRRIIKRLQRRIRKELDKGVK